MKRGRRLIVSLALALVLLVSVLVPVGVVFAGDNADVTITATPSYIAITNAPNAWTVGTTTVLSNTTYYSNPLGDMTVPSDPVVDGECRFTITNTSSVAIDLTVNMSHFSGGDAMQNSDTGSAGVGTFGAYSYCTGMTYSTGKVVAKTSSSAVMKDALAATTDIKWGLTVSTQTDAWTSGTAMTSTATITATAN